jgi:hypothetical protein
MFWLKYASLEVEARGPILLSETKQHDLTSKNVRPTGLGWPFRIFVTKLARSREPISSLIQLKILIKFDFVFQ